MTSANFLFYKHLVERDFIPVSAQSFYEKYKDNMPLNMTGQAQVELKYTFDNFLKKAKLDSYYLSPGQLQHYFREVPNYAANEFSFLDEFLKSDFYKFYQNQDTSISDYERHAKLIDFIIDYGTNHKVDNALIYKRVAAELDKFDIYDITTLCRFPRGDYFQRLLTPFSKSAQCYAHYIYNNPAAREKEKNLMLNLWENLTVKKFPLFTQLMVLSSQKPEKFTYADIFTKLLIILKSHAKEKKDYYNTYEKAKSPDLDLQQLSGSLDSFFASLKLNLVDIKTFQTKEMKSLLSFAQSNSALKQVMFSKYLITAFFNQAALHENKPLLSGIKKDFFLKLNEVPECDMLENKVLLTLKPEHYIQVLSSIITHQLHSGLYPHKPTMQSLKHFWMDAKFSNTLDNLEKASLGVPDKLEFVKLWEPILLWSFREALTDEDTEPYVVEQFEEKSALLQAKYPTHILTKNLERYKIIREQLLLKTSLGESNNLSTDLSIGNKAHKKIKTHKI